MLEFMLKPELPPTWINDAVFYQIFPDRFAKSARLETLSHLEPWDSLPTPHGYKGGDLYGVAEQIPYLLALGINAIYLCPIFRSASNHRYHTHDYFCVDEMLGGQAAFDYLLKTAHEHGIKIVLDGVFNHASRGFFQFHDLLENGAQSPFKDWFTVHDYPLNAYDGTPNYLCWYDNPALPKFNTANPEVREFIMRVAEHWLRLGIDGWRLDVPDEIDDDSFWQEFRSRCKKINPEAYIVGEIWGDARRWLAGDQFDAVMNYPFTRIALGFCGANTLRSEVIANTGLYADIIALDAPKAAALTSELLARHPLHTSLAQLNLLGSHDTPRMLSTLGSLEAAKLTVLMQMTFPGTPCVYYGDEIGLQGTREPACRGTIPWENTELWNADLHSWFKHLIALRHAQPALQRGGFKTVFAESQTFAFERSLEQDRILVILNASGDAVNFDLPGRWLDLLGNKTVSGTVVVPATQGLVFRALV
jgi:cyclomaltodextrinase / maltogenic alpha-amylase / neopullulanase